MSYLTPDLTGKNILYKVENDRRLVIVNNQSIDFHDSIFLNSIEIQLISTVANSATPIHLVQGLDWSITASDIDYEAMAAMRLREKTFKETLVHSLTIIKPHVADYTININYQKLYAVTSEIVLQSSPKKMNINPEVLYEMIEMVRRHELLLAPISNVHSITIKKPRLLEPDPHKENLDNVITEETYSLNVPSNVCVVHPVCGPFFKDSISIKRLDIDALLVEGTDYVIYGLDFAKTKNTTNTSGIYKFILFVKPFVCDVSIDYHAYGGDPTLDDLKAHDEAINNILAYIKDAQLLTAETVKNVPLVIEIINRVVGLEEFMRRLATEGRPTYGDVSSGGSLLLKVASPDTKFHWWTIAELYQIAGSTDVFVSGIMKMNVQTLLTKFSFSSYVNVDLNNPVNPLEVKVPTSLYPIGYVPYEDYSDLDNILRPQFRIIWNANTRNGSGIYLQIGMTLKTVVEETIVVEDVSGAESCWKRIPSSITAVLPQDTLITLPDGNSVWDIDNIDSKQESYLIPLTEGHIVWAGTEQLNRPNSGRKNIRLVHFLEKNTDISRVRKIRCDLEELNANKFPIYFDVISGSQDLLGVTAFNYNGKAVFMNVRMLRNTISKEIELTVDIDVTAGLSSNELNLRQVIIYT